MGGNIIEYNVKRLNALLIAIGAFGLVYFGAVFITSDDFKAGTINVRRLRLLNDMPYEWRLALVGVCVALFLAGGIAILKFVVRPLGVRVGDEGIEVTTPWRVVRARWSNFKSLRLIKALGTAVLLFDPPADGSRMARKVPLPGKMMGVNNAAVLVDMQLRLAQVNSGRVRGGTGRFASGDRPGGNPVVTSPASEPARTAAGHQRRAFGRRSP